MKLKYIILILIAFLTISKVRSQTNRFSVGMQMPDLKFSQTINFRTPNVKISDFRGKLLIIDFWATWCSPCVAEIPKIEAIKNKYKDSVSFLPVTDQNGSTVRSFLERLFHNEKIKMSSIFGDTILNKTFPHTSIPFFVWIDQKGKIIATTDATQITVQSIGRALHGAVSLTNRALRQYRAINRRQTIFPTTIAYSEIPDGDNHLIEPINSTDVLFQSVLTKYNPNLAGKTHYDSLHFVAINTPIINFYRLYYGSWVYKKNPLIFWSSARCKIEIADTILANKINSSKKGAEYLNWSVSNAYTYELYWANCKTWDEKFALLKSDIDHYFSSPLKIEAVIEKRVVASDVLVKISSTENLKTERAKSNITHDAFSYKQRNLPISAFIDLLESYYWQTSDRPVFDETGLTQSYDLTLECDMNDINQVNAQLAKYGLKFVTAERMADVLIIRTKTK